MRTILTHYPTETQRGQHFARTIEVGHFDICGADAFRIVRIGADARRQVELFGEFGRRGVVLVVGDLRVEHLDDVELVVGDERFEDRASHAGAFGVKRVRRVHQAALRLDAAHHLGHGQHVRNALGEKQTDQLSGRRADLFADDDTHAKLTAERGPRRVDRVVVGDAHHIQLEGIYTLDQLVQRRTRIAGGRGVQVTIKPDPTDRRWWGRPGGIQQHQGG